MEHTLNLFSPHRTVAKILSICVMNFNETGFNVSQSISIACKPDILLTCNERRRKKKNKMKKNQYETLNCNYLFDYFNGKTQSFDT